MVKKSLLLWIVIFCAIRPSRVMAQGRLMSAPLGERSTAVSTRPPVWRMDEETIARARAKKRDKEIWSASLPPTNRKQQLLGRPCSFAILDCGVYTPFDNRILYRQCSPFGIDYVDIDAPPQVGFARQIVPSSLFRSAIVFSDSASDADIHLFQQWQDKGTVLKGHKSPPWRVVFSHERLVSEISLLRLASISDDGDVCLWNAETGKLMANYPGPALEAGKTIERGEFPLFSPDSAWLAAVFGDKVAIYRAFDGEMSACWTIPPIDGKPANVPHDLF